jgi:small subunit ribosomal protein S2e
MSEENKPEQQPQEERGTRGGRGFGRGGRGGRGGKGGRPRRDEAQWVPMTNLGRLVNQGLVDLDTIFYHSMPIKEYQIVDKFFPDKQLKEECMAIKSVQKATKAGQRTRMKAVVAIGDMNGHIGLGSKTAKEVQTAMKGAIMIAKLNLIPVRRGFWGNKIKQPHTLPNKITGKCGSVRLRLIPAPLGTGVVGSPPTKKLLQFAGVHDCFSQSRGNTDTMENFVRAIYDALYKTYCYLTPDLWNIGAVEKHLSIQFVDNVRKEQ